LKTIKDKALQYESSSYAYSLLGFSFLLTGSVLCYYLYRDYFKLPAAPPQLQGRLSMQEKLDLEYPEENKFDPQLLPDEHKCLICAD
jgi:hypothetical protein